MALDVPPDVYQQALAHLRESSIIYAVATLHRAGIGIADAKRWAEELSSSADPEEAAVGRAFEAARRLRDEEAGIVAPTVPAASQTTGATPAPPAQRAAPAEQAPPFPYDDPELLVRALKTAIPARTLDRALDLLLRGVAPENDLASVRAAHLCRLSNSFCFAWRQGQSSQAEARAIVHSGAPGFSDASYHRAWENAMAVTGKG